MSNKNLGVYVTLDEELLQILRELSSKKGESISSTIRRYLVLGLNLAEDVGLSKLAEERLKDFLEKKALTHEEIWD